MSHGSLGYASLSGSSQSARLLRLQTATHALPCLRLPVGHSPNQASPPAGVRHMPGILASSRPLPQHGGYLWGIALIRYVNLFTSARRRRGSQPRLTTSRLSPLERLLVARAILKPRPAWRQAECTTPALPGCPAIRA